METMQSFEIQFITRQNKETEKSITIYVRITVNGSRAEVSLKQYIAPSDWNSHKGMGKGNKSEIKELNQFLNRARTRISNIYQDLLVDGDLPTASVVKNHFLGIEEQGGTILAAFDYHKKISESNLSVNTLKNYKTTQKYIKEFLSKKIHTSDAFLTKINYKFLSEFEYFLRKRKPTDHQRPLDNNGVMKHIYFLLLYWPGLILT